MWISGSLKKLALTGLQNNPFFYTQGVTREQLGALGDRLFDDLNEAMEFMFEGLPANAHIALVPEGPYAYARVE